MLGLVLAEEALCLDLRGRSSGKLLVEVDNTLHADGIGSSADSLFLMISPCVSTLSMRFPPIRDASAIATFPLSQHLQCSFTWWDAACSFDYNVPSAKQPVSNAISHVCRGYSIDDGLPWGE